MTHKPQYVRLVCSKRQHQMVHLVGVGALLTLALITMLLVVQLVLMYARVEKGMEGVRDVAKAKSAAIGVRMAQSHVLEDIPETPIWNTVSRTENGFTVFCQYGDGRLSIDCRPIGGSTGSTGRSAISAPATTRYRRWFGWNRSRPSTEFGLVPGAREPIDSL